MDPMDCQQLMSQLLALITRLDLKLKNVSTDIFRETKQTQRNQFAAHIHEIKCFEACSHDPHEICSAESFPIVEVVQLVLQFKDESSDLNIYKNDMIVARNFSILSTEKMPNLRKVKIWFSAANFCDNMSELMSSNWNNLANVEELIFENAPLLLDVAFIGMNGELPFLQLKSKRLFSQIMKYI